MVLELASALIPALDVCKQGPAAALNNPATNIAGGVLGLGVTLLVAAQRRKTQAKARRLKYSSRFDAEWEALLQTANALEELRSISEECRKAGTVSKLLQTYPVVEMKEQKSRTFAAKASSSKQTPDAPEGKLVRRLEQLYALAAGAQVLLQSKVQELAAAHRGLLPVTPQRATLEAPEQHFVRWSEASRAQRDAVVWAPLKPEKRVRGDGARGAVVLCLAAVSRYSGRDWGIGRDWRIGRDWGMGHRRVDVMGMSRGG